MGDGHLLSLALPFQPIPVHTKSRPLLSRKKAKKKKKVSVLHGGVCICVPVRLEKPPWLGRKSSLVPWLPDTSRLGLAGGGLINTLTVCFMLIVGERSDLASQLHSPDDAIQTQHRTQHALIKFLWQCKHADNTVIQGCKNSVQSTN